MIITIAGLPGSGKTTVAKMIAKSLGYSHHSIGDMRGSLAEKKGITIDELNAIGATEDWPHTEVDKLVEEWGKTKDDMVIDTWVGFHFIPKSVKIFLSVDIHSAAERIFKDQANRPDERSYVSVADVEETLRKRTDTCDAAFKRLYNIDFQDASNYDLVFDTTDLAVEEVIDKIMEFVKKKK